MKTAHDRWFAAVPEALRASLESLESGPMGLPRPESDAIYDAAVSALRASGKDEAVRLTPPRRPTLEQAIAYIEEDELVEVTPKSIRLRKKVLNPSFRKKRVKEE